MGRAIATARWAQRMSAAYIATVDNPCLVLVIESVDVVCQVVDRAIACPCLILDYIAVFARHCCLQVIDAYRVRFALVLDCCFQVRDKFLPRPKRYCPRGAMVRQYGCNYGRWLKE